MDNNEILVRIKDAVSLDDARLVAIFALGGESIDEDTTRAMLSDPSGPDSVTCKGDRLLRFLDGFILDQRGQRPTTDKTSEPQPEPLSNNVVLKKLRIALQLKEDDVLRILASGGTALSRRQLGALARKRGNKHYRVCSDEVLTSFLAGLSNSDWRSRVPFGATLTGS
jgi:uncharacterized protein YehS (DUF1456 family)